MSDDKTDACLRLEFFKAAILQPAFEREREPTNWDNADTIISAFGAIEAAHWASLGTRIGYFDGKEVRSAILSESLVKAWLDMRNRQLISSGDVWGSVLEQRSGNLVLNEQLFPLHVQSDEFTTEILHEAFQTFLLLTGESIVDRESLYFLSSIGWTDDRVWEARKDGMVREHKGFRARYWLRVLKCVALLGGDRSLGAIAKRSTRKRVSCALPRCTPDRGSDCRRWQRSVEWRTCSLHR
jgi:hypothetical protein